MNTSCIFCKIRDKEIPSEVLYEDDNFFVIKDIQPQAKTHLLVISKRHFTSVLDHLDSGTNSNFLEVFRVLSKEFNIPQFRIQINTGESEGQSVFHFHGHFLSNSKLKSGEDFGLNSSLEE